MTTHTDLIARLRVIANAIADGNYSELTMRIPAEPDRDADIVVMRSALALESLEQQVAALKQEHEFACEIGADYRDKWMAAQAREAKLREALVDYDNQASEYDGRTSKELGDRIKSLLALPADDSALQERLKQEREQLIDDWTTTIATCYKSDDLLTAEQVVDLLCPSDKKADAIRGLA